MRSPITRCSRHAAMITGLAAQILILMACSTCLGAEQSLREVTVESTLDKTMQPSLLYTPEKAALETVNAEPVPLRQFIVDIQCIPERLGERSVKIPNDRFISHLSQQARNLGSDVQNSILAETRRTTWQDVRPRKTEFCTSDLVVWDVNLHYSQ